MYLKGKTNSFFGVLLMIFTLSEILIISFKIRGIKCRYHLAGNILADNNQGNRAKKRCD